ncbi:MAG: helix-turn-helix domain-containing protein, partial [Schleiferiaceae bacterium]|nr:helix-turn-helix domain-containing protein [Schleiferiaceae bacterium]
PLRERREDIHLLFRKFARDFSDKYHHPPIRLTETAVQLLERYHWPGNIRQLRNLAEQISVIERGQEISEEILRTYIPELGGNTLPAISKYTSSQFDFEGEREMIYKALFDLKADVNDLRKLVLEMAQHTDIEAVKADNPNLFHRIIEAENTPPTREHRAAEENYPIKSNYMPIIERPDSVRREDFLDGETVEEENLSLLDKEVEMIRKSLERHHGRRREAAEELGISERTLYRKIKQFNLS